MAKFCSSCKKEINSIIPFHCRYCGEYFCEEHRIPESHNCKFIKIGWDSYKREQDKYNKRPGVAKKPIIRIPKTTQKPIVVTPPAKPEGDKEQEKILNKCSFCSKQTNELTECKYCKDVFCKDHSDPRTPHEFLRSKGGHCCKLMSTQQKETEKRPITQKEPLYKHSNMLIAWFFWKKHPHSKLWLNNFFLQLTILIVVSALFIFIYTYASSFNTIVISIFKLGSLIQICLIIIMVYTFYKLLKNIRYGIKGLANGFKLIAAVIFLLFCFEIFLQPGTLIEPLSRFDYSTFNPFEINLNSQNNGIISNNNENSDNNQGIVIPSINPKPVINIPELETQIHNLINIERQKNGVSTLQYDTKLSQIARAHSQDMANKNYFEHVNPQGDGPTERAIKAGYPVHKELGAGWYRDGIGENIYQNNLYDTVTYYNGVPVYDWNSQSEIASTTVNGWMNSPGHRQNILDSSYSNEGIGVSISSDDKVYITEDFW